MDYLNKAYLLIGGNMGNRLANIDKAVNLLQKHIGNIIARSSVYETAPWGIKQQSSFLNLAVEIDTEYQAGDLMRLLLKIEAEMGRIRQEKYGPRTIDLDIIFFNQEVVETAELIIPHKEMQNRRFVLQPLSEIAPLLVHPVLKKTVLQLLEECPDDSEVSIFTRNDG